MFVSNKNIFKTSVLGLSIFGSTVACAVAQPDDYQPQVQTKGGLLIGVPESDFWFGIGGEYRFDGTVFTGDKTGTTYKNNLNLRTAKFELQGGIGKDLNYLFSVEMDSDRSFKLKDAYVAYSFPNNAVVFMGQVNPAFSLENTSSTKWLPFLERSIPATAFGPGMGLGFGGIKWDDRYTLAASFTTPKKGDDTSGAKGDKWTSSARFAVVPYLRNENSFVQIGVSGHYQSVDSLTVRAFPEASARTTNAMLTTGLMNAKNLYTWGVELSAQNGPFVAEVEYQKETINRSGASSVSFDGYHAQASYVLTGESRNYNRRFSTYGQVIPESKYGAVEVAARYSYVNLNDKDINGGSANSGTLGLNWYLTDNLKVSGNYVRTNIDAPTTETGLGKRKLNIFAARFQFIF